MLTITWTNPPTPAPDPRTTEIDSAADQLLNNPGQWGLIWTGIKTSTARSRTRALRDRDPRIRCRLVTHTDPAVADLYAVLPQPATNTLQVAS